ncbi:LacI family transcriptional regulator [Curtobacterium sp. PhB130]|uniref:LacI family DNA-binding transcriptional regulator n=1 Tax=unclassified Curtobacterium TaxID=257496 RepID=UPI000F4C3EB2|nr:MULTISPECIES: LacI family DNA-binding transcriptional regulator [unclassified Curtobacterium]ROP64814.1 LacI family transcriptional regulator [Curtobacterium sp. ZW137]ROS75106.1 LacI family transcriptional regulator [Curtobacterium sp. PhB130]TCK63734.1 LacI family transcriptional regulator [Curtobacterium sp. PhB136]
METAVGTHPGPGRVTIADVARAAGVSIPTVSKVINNRDGVASATMLRVQEVVERLGYETSLVARSLRSSRTGVIGILVPEFEPFSTELLRGVSAAAIGTGYELLAYAGLVTGASQPGWERRSLSRLSGTLIDGAIVVTPTTALPTSSIPVVAIDPHTGPEGHATVDTDNEGGARSAVEHLLALGHTRIAHIHGRADLASAQLRETGYRGALAAAGIHVDEDLVRAGDYQEDRATAVARELLSIPDRPTAVFAANDSSAIGVLHAAAALGLRVPEDLSVIGFDDVPQASTTTPPLTTVAQPLADLGAAAVEMLLTMLRGEPSPEHVRLSTSLRVRQSTGPVPS